MTDSNGNFGWGVGAATLIGAGLGYFAGRGGFYGNGGYGYGYNGQAIGPDSCGISAANSKLDSLAATNDFNATQNAITGVRDKIVDLTKDTYQLGIQNLKSNEDIARMIESNACRTNDIIHFDGDKTRLAIDNFKQMYMNDRIHDLELENSQLKNNISLAPLTCSIRDIQATLNEVTGCKGVKICKPCECACGL